MKNCYNDLICTFLRDILVFLFDFVHHSLSIIQSKCFVFPCFGFLLQIFTSLTNSPSSHFAHVQGFFLFFSLCMCCKSQFTCPSVSQSITNPFNTKIMRHKSIICPSGLLSLYWTDLSLKYFISPNVRLFFYSHFTLFPLSFISCYNTCHNTRLFFYSLHMVYERIFLLWCYQQVFFIIT